MSFYQQGVCYSSVESAKADFISRVADVNARADTIRLLDGMDSATLQAFFPDCVHGSVQFSIVLSVVLPLVILLITLGYIKRSAQL